MLLRVGDRRRPSVFALVALVVLLASDGICFPFRGVPAP